MLGLLSFLLYINDLLQVLKISNCHFYADETVIFTSDSKPDTINSKLSSDLQGLHCWLQANYLTVNIKKTECMYFYSPRKQLSMSNPISGQKLSITNTFKYLGVHLDSHLIYKYEQQSTKKLPQNLLSIFLSFWNLPPYNNSLHNIILFTCLVSHYKWNNWTNYMVVQ